LVRRQTYAYLSTIDYEDEENAGSTLIALYFLRGANVVTQQTKQLWSASKQDKRIRTIPMQMPANLNRTLFFVD
jgi:hypothetical protein